jgi:hypothetical protein
MLKLYRKFEYWEAWDAGSTVTIHWGTVGERGEIRSVQKQPLKPSEKTIESESQPRRSEGFREIPFERHIAIVVQYRLDSWGSPEDLGLRHKVEGILNECLGWTGNGFCDGGDIGSGVMNVFSYVVNPDVAIETIRDELSTRKLLGRAVIAVREGEDYRVAWPESYSDEFSIF